MPIALEAKRNRWPYVLSSDRDKPEAQRPTFYFRVLSLRRFKAASASLDVPAGDGRVMADAFCSLLKPMLVGWQNMETDDPDVAAEFGLAMPDPAVASFVALPFDADKLDVILSVAELRELVEAVMRGGVSEDDRKN